MRIWTNPVWAESRGQLAIGFDTTTGAGLERLEVVDIFLKLTVCGGVSVLEHTVGLGGVQPSDQERLVH